MDLRQLVKNVTLLGCLGLVIGLGCSSSDNKGTNARQLSSEEEFALLESNGLSMEDMGPTILPLVLSQAGTSFWDGVDTSDFGGFGFGGLGAVPFGQRIINNMVTQQINRAIPKGRNGAETAALLSSSIFPASVAAESVSVKMNYLNGWWIATANVDLDIDSAGIMVSLHATVIDSVRFENSQGFPFVEPDDSTARVRVGSHVNASLSADINSQEQGVNLTINLEINGGSHVDVSQLNTSVGKINGTGDLAATIGFNGQVPDSIPGQTMSMSMNGKVNLTTNVADLMVPEPTGDAEGCPTSGTVTAGFGLDLSVMAGKEKESAKGNWDVTVTFTGNGMANVTVNSGDFSKSATSFVCSSF